MGCQEPADRPGMAASGAVPAKDLPGVPAM